MISPEERKPQVFPEAQSRGKITWEDLYTYLYGRRDVEAVDPEEIKEKRTKRRRLSKEKFDAGL
jgi:hypothetical protein